MTPERAKKLGKSPAVQGNMSIEDIVKADWKRNFEGRGFTLDDARMAVAQHAQSGEVARLRNTLFLLPDIQGDEERVEFHTVTADPFEVYSTLLLMFALALAEKTDIQYLFSYINDKAIYRRLRRVLGDAADVEDSPNEDKGRYMATIDLPLLYDNARRHATRGETA